MKRLTAELNLTQDQQDEVEEVVEETQLQLQQLRAQYHPQMEKIIETGITTMKTRLTAEQQKKLDALYEKVKKRWALRRSMRENTQ
jgi:Spy/CpxP family protein refolding chaperone